jgi:hypothetical protein
MFVPVTLLLVLTAPASPDASTSASPDASTSASPLAPTSATPGATTPAPTTTATPANGPVAQVDGFVLGHVALGAGAGLAALSTAAFVAGFDVERELRVAPHDRGVVDVLLIRRAVAAGVAWPAAVLAVVGVGVGVGAIALDPVRDAPTETP